MKTPWITEAPSIEDAHCATCGAEIESDGGTVWIVDPDGWHNVCCSPDCADEEAYALADINEEILRYEGAEYVTRIVDRRNA